MRLKATVEDQLFDLEIKRDGRRVVARIDDREYDLEASEVEPGVFLLKHDNRIYQVYVAPSGIVNIGSEQFSVSVADPRKLGAASGNAAAADGVAEIKTAMPGKLVRVLAAAGQEVSQGDGIVIVEAMKMQNEMKSPKDGVVREIRFAEGATVNAGDVLAVIE